MNHKNNQILSIFKPWESARELSFIIPGLHEKNDFLIISFEAKMLRKVSLSWCEALSSDFPSWGPFGPFRGVLLGVWPGPLWPKVFPIQLIDMIKSFLKIPLILYVDFEFSIDFFRGGPQIPAGRRVWGHFGVIFRKNQWKTIQNDSKSKNNQILAISKPWESARELSFIIPGLHEKIDFWSCHSRRKYSERWGSHTAGVPTIFKSIYDLEFAKVARRADIKRNRPARE